MNACMRSAFTRRALRQAVAQQRASKATFTVSDEHKTILAQTAPAVVGAGPAVTKHFYNRLFTAVPCLRNVFNQTNQAKGEQQQRLFDSIVEAAVSVLEDRAVDMLMVEGICHRHVALGVVGAQYEIVGEHLLGTISEVLTDDPKVLEAWGGLYGEVATAMKTVEMQMYEKAAAAPGGWKGKREFTIAKREMVSDVVARITFMPTDGEAVSAFQHGQYTTVWAKGDGWKYEQPRHYTLAVDDTDLKGYTISVRRQGLMSDFLHTADIGTKVHLSVPCGNFRLSNAIWMKEPAAPVVFLSAGIGITPPLAMLEALNGSSNKGPVTWLHAGKSGREHAYRARLMRIAAVNDHLTRRVWYEAPVEEDGVPCPEDNQAKYHFEGRMDLASVKDLLHLDNPAARYYCCGPPEFMGTVGAQLESLGMPKDNFVTEGY